MAVVITWKGKEPDLPSIMLNSHIDVVPVFPVSSLTDTILAELAERSPIIIQNSSNPSS